MRSALGFSRGSEDLGVIFGCGDGPVLGGGWESLREEDWSGDRGRAERKRLVRKVNRGERPMRRR